MSSPLEGRSALVVGANGRLGRAIAEALGTAGARLLLAARDERRLDQLCADLDDRGIVCRAAAADVRDDDAVQALVAEAAGTGMDIAVNNAGATHQPARLGDLAIEDADRVLQVTLRGTLVAMKHELAGLPGGGAIVNIASTAGMRGTPGMAAYVAAKHGVIGVTRTAALDYADRGIRVNAVAPGSIDSGGVAAQSEQTRRLIASGAPLRRLAAPEEIAAAATWLASPAASYITGTVLAVDGGKTARGA